MVGSTHDPTQRDVRATPGSRFNWDELFADGQKHSSVPGVVQNNDVVEIA